MTNDNQSKTGNHRRDIETFYTSFEENVLSANDRDKNYMDFLLEKTEQFTRNALANSITKTQLRNLFDTLKNCESNEEMQMRRPQLLYTAGRLEGESKKFIVKLANLIRNLKDKDDCRRVNKFIEAVIAYHKYHAKK